MKKYYNTTKKLTSIAHKLKPNNIDRLYKLYGKFTHKQRRILLNPKTPLHRIIRLIRIVDKTEKHKTRVYPEIEVGDYVRIHRNKDKLDKEHVSTWSDKRYKVNRITESFGQKLYFLEGYTQNNREAGLLRHDILLTA
mgnify:CR=1 FL=1